MIIEDKVTCAVEREENRLAQGIVMKSYENGRKTSHFPKAHFFLFMYIKIRIAFDVITYSNTALYMSP